VTAATEELTRDAAEMVYYEVVVVAEDAVRPGGPMKVRSTT
jgi:hypothetical protein